MTDLDAVYADALASHIAAGDFGEGTLAAAYDLGRRCLDDGLGVLDLHAVHAAAVTLVGSASTATDAFLAEALSPFEMVLCGLREHVERLEETNAALRDAMEIKTEFLAVASHELRTPLTPIVGAASTLLRASDRLGADATHELLQGIVRNGFRLKHLVNNILIVSRLDSGDVERPDTERATVATAVSNVAAELETDPVLTGALDLPLRIAGADLELILSNLFSNARVYGAAPIGLDVSLEADGVMAVISVTDGGAGVPAAFRDRLFLQFSQSDTGLRRQSKGMGLGLHVVRELARLHGGDAVYAADHPPTRFEVRLPVG